MPKLLLSFLLLITLEVFAKGTPFAKRYGLAEGLPTLTIYDLYQAKDGYLYLGTDLGMYRFNGITFTEIPFKNTLSTAVSFLNENERGEIWCMNFSGELFYLKDNKLVPQFNDSVNIPRLRVSAYQIYNNTLWFTTSIDLYRFDLKENKLHRIYSFTNSMEEYFYSLEIDTNQNTVYACSNKFIYTFENNNFQEEKLIPTEATEVAWITLFGNKLIGRNRKVQNSIVALKQYEQQFYTNLDTSNKVLFNHFAKTKNKLWACSTDGFSEIDTLNKILKTRILKGHRVSDVIEDKEQNLWVSTLEDGIFMFPNNEINIRFETSDNSKLQCVASGPSNTFFIGTNKGEVLQITETGNLIKIFPTVINNEISYIYYDKASEKLFTSEGIFNASSGKLIMEKPFGKMIAQDNQRNFLVANSNFSGIYFTDTLSNRFKIFSTLYGKIFYEKTNLIIVKISYERTRICFFDKQNQVYYFGCSNGLFAVDSLGKKTEITFASGEKIIGQDVVEGDNNTFWVATSGNGVVAVQNKKATQHFNIAHGLSSNNCKRIAVLKNDLVVVTNYGFDKINLSSEKVIDLKSILALNNQIIKDLIYVDKKIWLITNTQIIEIPNKVNLNLHAPEIILKQISINNNPVSDLNKIEFSNRDLYFEFDFIKFTNAEKINWYYQIEGYSNEWKPQNVQNKSLNLLALAPGKYKLNYYAESANQKSEIKTIDFSISKPFWQKIWFYIVIILVMAFLIVLVYRYNSNYTKKKQIIKESLAMSQLTALRAQMNPHFLFNVLNSVQGLIYSNRKADAAEYLGKFSDLMRKTLEMSDKQFISLQKEIDTLDIYLDIEAQRFNGDFNYAITVDPTIEPTQIFIPTMIIQPFVENSVKHGLLHQKGQKNLLIHISSSKKRKDILISIEDNGIGRAASKIINQKKQKPASFALNAISNRIQILNKLLKDPIVLEIIDLEHQGQSAGTKVNLTLPINHE